MALEPGQMFLINIDVIEKLQYLPSSIRVAILKAKSNGYYCLEEFLREISTPDLESLQQLFDRAMSKHEESLAQAVMISVTLAQLEGVPMEQDSSAKEFFGTMFIGLNLEGLSRKGIVNIKREHMNFLAVNEPIMELTEKGRRIADNLKGNIEDV